MKSQYGKDVVTAGPSFASAKRDGPKVVVAFKDLTHGLATSDGKTLTWLQLSADGKNFVPAEAAIVGEAVEVSAPVVPEPKFVRMGWSESDIPNLKGKSGWPVFAFASQPVEQQE